MFFNSSLINKVQKVVNLAREQNLKIACAESCTGGLLSALFTEVAGVSRVFDRGFITYTNLAKTEILGVGKKTLDDFGAVSFEVASEMVLGAVKNSQANLAVAITGIAGPSGGSNDKPVGLVYIGVCIDGKVMVRRFNFAGDRVEVRKSSMIAALDMVLNVIS